MTSPSRSRASPAITMKRQGASLPWSGTREADGQDRLELRARPGPGRPAAAAARSGGSSGGRGWRSWRSVPVSGGPDAGCGMRGPPVEDAALPSPRSGCRGRHGRSADRACGPRRICGAAASAEPEERSMRGRAMRVRLAATALAVLVALPRRSRGRAAGPVPGPPRRPPALAVDHRARTCRPACRRPSRRRSSRCRRCCRGGGEPAARRASPGAIYEDRGDGTRPVDRRPLDRGGAELHPAPRAPTWRP